MNTLMGSASSWLYFIFVSLSLIAATCRIHRSTSHICSCSLQQAHTPTYCTHTHIYTHTGTQIPISSLDFAAVSAAGDQNSEASKLIQYITHCIYSWCKYNRHPPIAVAYTSTLAHILAHIEMVNGYLQHLMKW